MSTERTAMPATQWAGEIILLGKSMTEQWKVVHKLSNDSITHYHRSGTQAVDRIQELNHVLQLNNRDMRSAYLSVLAKTTGVSFKQENKDLMQPMVAKHNGKRMNKAIEENGSWESVLDSIDGHAAGLKSETEFKKAKAAKKGNAEEKSEENSEVKEGLGVVGADLLKDGKADAVTMFAAAIAAQLREAQCVPTLAVQEAMVALTAEVAATLKNNDEQAAVAAVRNSAHTLHDHVKTLAGHMSVPMAAVV